jgi:hypothetical protein
MIFTRRESSSATKNHPRRIEDHPQALRIIRDASGIIRDR